MLWVALHFPFPLPPGALQRIAAWACRFTPRVSLEPPSELLLEVQGSVRLFRGIEALERRLLAGIAAMGLEARLAVSPTPRAALWHSRGVGGRLEALPVEVACAGEPLELLHRIGVSTLGGLMKLPREGLAHRCGPELALALDRALGRAPEPRAFFSPPERFDAALELPSEIEHAEGALFAARRLLVQLEGLLAARQAGIREFILVLVHADARESRLAVRLASPAREAERFAGLLRERLAAFPLPGAVRAIRLEAKDFTPLHGASAGLFGDAQAEAEGWARLLERLCSRLGEDAVHGLRPHADHRPERAWRPAAAGSGDRPAVGEGLGPRPVWLVEPPRRLGEGGFALLAGPERIESGWWDGAEAKRDYFVARFPDASLAWVYREAQGWFLHGFFA